MYPGSDGVDLTGSKQAEGGRPVSTKEVRRKRSSFRLTADSEITPEVMGFRIQNKTTQHG